MSDYHYYDLQASTSRCKKLLIESRPSSSNHDMADDRSYGSMFSEDVNGSSRAAAVGQLGERLRVLEEEGEMLKAALFQSVEERTELISDINEHFNSLQHLQVPITELKVGVSSLATCHMLDDADVIMVVPELKINSSDQLLRSFYDCCKI
ncbi:hypothetical protein OROMI_004136 [Orobanche minor]